MKRLISFILVLSMVLPMLCFSASSEDSMPVGAVLEVSDVNCATGTTFNFSIKITKNYGVAGIGFEINYPDALEIMGISKGNAVPGLDMIVGNDYTANPYNVNFDGIEADSTTGTAMTISFKVKENAGKGTYPITVSVTNAHDNDLNGVYIAPVTANINIRRYTLGDITGDNIRDLKDVTALRRYLAGGYNVLVVEPAMDVTRDGIVDLKDVTFLRRYLAGGYGLELPDVDIECNHTMKKTEKVEATCTTTGNIEYWTCTLCGKLYEDEAGSKEIKLEDTVTNGNHIVTHFPKKEASFDLEGNIEYWTCSSCNGVFSNAECTVKISIADTVIPMLDRVSHTISYNLFDNDSYLEKNESSIVNNNPYIFYEDEEIGLNDAEMTGYAFDGWYNGTGDNADRITKISKGTKTNIKLYARWTVQRTYTVYFVSEGAACDVIYGGETVNKIVKPMNEQLILPAPAMKGYIFLCWTDGDGNIVTSIEPGSYGEITLSAHWTSERNQTRPVKELGNPVIIEDETEEKIHFIYELGDIINVPLEVIENFGNVDRLERESETVTVKAMTQATAENVSKTVANLVSNSSSTTLSNEWNENISVSEEQSSDISQEDIDVISDRVENGGQWNISKSNGGATEYSVTTGESASSTHKSTTAAVLSKNMTLKSNVESGFSGEFNIGSSSKSSTEKTQNFNIGLNGSLGIKKPGKDEGSENSGGLGLNLGYSNGRKTYKENESHQDLTLGTYVKIGGEKTKEKGMSISASTEDSSECKEYTDLTSSSTSTWNTEEGYIESRDDAHEESYTTAISKAIGEKFNYSTTSGSTSGESNTAASVKQNENKDEFSSTVEFVIEEKDETRTSSKVYKDYGGYHRLVEAGTLHVFGIVSYDIANRTFYTSTYSILDPETAPFYDYSKDGTYKDRENGILPFEIPFFVNKYIAANVSYTNGLEIEPETGDVHNYKGSAKNVLMPNYYSADNGDNTREAVKVTKMLPYIFQNNTNIESVTLSDYITEIPEGAFMGCTNLKTIIAPGVTSIGKNAFKDCNSLNKFTVSSQIAILGEKAFDGVPEIIVYARNSDVAKSAINSGAKRISLYLEDMSDNISNYTIETQSNTEYFALYGAGKTFDNVNVISTADETTINRATFNSDFGIGIDISSSKLTLNQVNVNSKTIALLLRKPSTDIYLERTCNFSSESGHTVVTNEISIVKTTTYAAYFKVEGNMLVNGTVDFSGIGFVSPKNSVVQIDEAKYNVYIKPIIVTFNPNGGAVFGEETKTVYYGEKYGELPSAGKTYYNFDGWYDKNGNLVTADTVLDKLEPTTLWAYWSPRVSTLYFNANGGTVDMASKPVTYKQPYGALPNPVRQYYTFDGWYTAQNGGEKVTSETVFGIGEDTILYAHWSNAPFTLNFNANGGTVEITSKTVYCNQQMGELPVPTKDYKRFIGWFDSPDGGNEIKASDIIASHKDLTLYAHWKNSDTSGYVRAENAPSDAPIALEKWTYTLRTNTESSETSLSGYTQYDSYWIELSSDSYQYSTEFPSGFATNHWLYTDLEKASVEPYETETSKREVENTWAGYIYWHWMYSCSSNGTPNRAIYHKEGWGPDNGYHYKYFYAFTSTKGNYSSSYGYCNSQNILNYVVNDQKTSQSECGGSTRWFRFNYYTCNYTYYEKVFKFYKLEQKESSTPVYASDTILDVQHWVSYYLK